MSLVKSPKLFAVRFVCKNQTAPKTGLFLVLVFLFGVEKTLFHFFWVGLRLGKKMKVCFVRWCGRNFFTNLFLVSALEVQ